jgi:hypothetical protein
LGDRGHSIFFVTSKFDFWELNNGVGKLGIDLFLIWFLIWFIRGNNSADLVDL